MRVSTQKRWWKRAAWIALGLSLLWLGFVLSLDLRYDMLPRTTNGGLKILAAVWILFALLAATVGTVKFLGRRIYRGLRRSKDEG